MEKFVGVTFKNKDDIFYFLVEKNNPKKNITVIVETDQGLQFGKVVTKIMDDDLYAKKKHSNHQKKKKKIFSFFFKYKKTTPPPHNP